MDENVQSIIGPRDRLLERLHNHRIMLERGVRREDFLLTSGEVAMVFRVSNRAVRCWADDGKLPYIRTLGGHRRFLASAVYNAFENPEGVSRRYRSA